MSDFIKNQLSQIGIRMNGGLPRFQAQVLKKLRIPCIEEFDSQTKSTLIHAYDTFNLTQMNATINKYCIEHNLL